MIVTAIVCDPCGAIFQESPTCERVHQMRREARQAGWKRGHNHDGIYTIAGEGRCDYCPACVAIIRKEGGR
jgi:hypothetical protein